MRKFNNLIISILVIIGETITLNSCSDSELAYPNIAIKVENHFLQGNDITCIAFGSNGTAWIGAFENKLIKYSNGFSQIFDSTNSAFKTKWIHQIAVDQQNNVWITSSGLIKFDGKTWTYPLVDRNVWSMELDKKNTLWVSGSGATGRYLAKYSNNSWTYFTEQNTELLKNYFINDIAVDAENNLVFALQGMTVNNSCLGFYKYNAFSKSDKIDVYWWKNIDINARGIIYATIDYGLSSCICPNRPQMLEYSSTKTKYLEPRIDSTNVMSGGSNIVCDKAGNAWLGFTENEKIYIAVYNGNIWNKLQLNYPIKHINCISLYDNNKIWLGTDNGVIILNSANLW